MLLRFCLFLAATAAGLAANPAVAANPCRFAHASEVVVSTAAQLTRALAEARPGRMIRLAPGTYAGRFKATAQGTATQPIVLCGPRAAVLDGGTVAEGYVLHLDRAVHWIVSGFTVRKGKDGVMLDRAHRNRLTGLLVHTVGHSGIHFRTNSTRNAVDYSEIRDTGKSVPGYGEGVYIGTAVSNWPAVMGSSTTPDRSDYNRVRYNHFGPNVAAEAVDIKEGTRGGRIVGNVFDGTGMSGANYADSWVDVKGNGYLIEQNTGSQTLRDAYQVHVVVQGWGNDNVFRDNLSQLYAPGYGFSIHDIARGNIVACDNAVAEAGSGLATIDCTP